MTDLPILMDPRWAAVQARDVLADGRFVYAVVTTGIYCRPSCPARNANPENLRFYPDAQQAEAAGFRPCLRCHPQKPLPENRGVKMVRQACQIMAETEPVPPLADLAAQLGVSGSYLQRVFKARTGLSPKQWAMAQRDGALRDLLARQGGTVTEAIYEAGFNAPSRFYERATEMLGMSPQSYRAGGKGADILFAVAQSALGAVLVARTVKGISAIDLGDDAQILIDQFQDRFPNARLDGSDRDFQLMVAQVIGMVEKPKIGLDLPLDIQGTAFQQRVWQALRQIPPGETATYSQIAGRLGVPKAVRAVANACGANKLAVAVPCHRVVRLDGSVTGYRWGIDRKRSLLQLEAEQAVL